MEIERKYKIECLNDLPENYRAFPCHAIEQAYLCTDPVVRVRREDDSYYLTYKGKGLLAREEYNLPLTKESYEHLLKKADGLVLTKVRLLKFVKLLIYLLCIPWDFVERLWLLLPLWLRWSFVLVWKGIPNLI